MKTNLAKIVILFLIGLLAACNGGGGSSGGGSNGPSTAPMVIMDGNNGGVANGASGVSLTPSIVLQFSTSMNSNSINTGSVILSKSVTTISAIALTSIVSSVDNTIFSTSPESSLEPNTKYYVIVNSNAKSSSGAALSPTTFNFTTGSFTTPTVAILSPANKATGVSTNPSIQIQFSTAVANVSTNVSLHEGGTGGTEIPISAIIGGSNNTYTFSPVNNLSQQTTYYVVVDSGITDTSSNPLTATSFSFTSGTTAAPTVNMISPANGSGGVSLNPGIQLQFSKAVQNVATNVSLYQGSAGGQLIPISSITGGSNNTYTFSPISSLLQNTTYYVEVNNGITDSSGNPVATTIFSFTTATLAIPSVNLLTPSNGESGVSLNPSIQLQFSTAVLNVATNISLHQDSPTGGLVNIGAIIGGANNTYTFSPVANLNQQTTYYIVVSNGITDNSGNPINTTVFNFIAGAGTAPTVNIITPNNGATGVSLSPSIQLQFSKAVLNVATNISLYQGSTSGTLIPISSVSAGNNNTYTFSPVSSLIQQTTYYVVVRSGITDTSGNPLAVTTFSFTTGTVSIPTVSMLAPSNGATGVSLNPSIQVQFSKAVLNVATNIGLYQGSPSGTLIPISSITAGANNTYTFSPVSNLSQQTTYYVVISDGITDTSGNQVAATNFGFTTGTSTAPTVAILTPQDGATGISLTPNIQIQFSTAVQNVATNLSLYQGSPSGILVPISSSISGAGNTYTFSPINSLLQGATYYVVVGNNITDTSGNPVNTTTFSFTTGTVAAPTVSILSPADGSNGISTSTSIQIQFSTAVQNVATNVSLRQGSASGPLVNIGSITVGANNIYTFSPVSNLSQQTIYYVVVNNGITDSLGNPLTTTTFSFTTGATVIPTVSILAPSNGATGVSINPSIQIQFSTAVQNVATNVSLRQGSESGSLVPISAITAGANNIYTFSPVSNLTQQTAYYVVVGNGITDNIGTPVTETIFSFTVGTFPMTTATMLTPANNSVNLIKVPSIKIQFSNSVQNVNTSTVFLYAGSLGGTLVPISTPTLGAGNTYTFTPLVSNLMPMTTYYLLLTNGIEDVNGNQLVLTIFNFASNIVTQSFYDQSSSGTIYSNGISVDINGNSFISGGTSVGLSGQSQQGNYDYFLAKYGNTGSLLWSRQVGATGGNTVGSEIGTDANGNSYITGYTTVGLSGQSQQGTDDYFIAKYDESGNLLWSRQVGTAGGYADGQGISVNTNGGNLYVTGNTTAGLSGQAQNGETDYFIAQYNLSGNLQWSRQVGAGGQFGGDITEATAVTYDNNGNGYVVGSTTIGISGQSQQGNFDYFLAKYNSTGTLQWTNQVGAFGGTTVGYGVDTDSSGNIYITGGTTVGISGQSQQGSRDYFLAKYDSTGDLVWARQFNNYLGGGDQIAMGITLDSSNNIYLAGQGNTYGYYFIIKYIN